MIPYKPSPNAIITKLVQGNPKEPGSRARRRFGFYRSGMTVQEFLDSGGLIGDIYWDLSRAFIVVSDYPYGQADTTILKTLAKSDTE